MTDLHGISQAAFDLIVAEEVGGGEDYYTAHYQRPERPGGASGITIGIGFDCGFSTATQIGTVWAALPPPMVTTLQSVAGLTGSSAQARLASVRSVIVPWSVAIDVFSNVDLPKWVNIVKMHLPNTDKLSPDCLGVLVSLTYNRGPSFDAAGDRYAEMRAIKAHMASCQFDRIPGDLRSMKRLWTTQSVRGVARRRDHEAALFQKGLADA